MLDLHRFTTASVEAARRLDYWNGLVDGIYPGTWLNADRPDFQAEMSSWQVGQLAMLRPRSGPVEVGRHRRTDGEDRLILHLQRLGRMEFRQQRRDCELRAGDFVLGPADEPYGIRAGTHELLIVEFPRGPLAERVRGLDDRLDRRIAGASPAGRVLHDYLVSLWRQSEHPQLDADWTAGLSAIFFDLLAMALRTDGGEARCGRPGPDLKARLLAMVEDLLGEPELNAVMLAGRCGTSVRTVQNLFAGLGTTPSAWILERRLMRAADCLAADPGASVTQIAFEAGFGDSGYFSRCFRQRFGTAPRRWRQAWANGTPACQSRSDCALLQEERAAPR